MHGRTRCPSCASSVRPGEAWCSLCHAALVGPGDVDAVPVDAVPVDAVPVSAELVSPEQEEAGAVPQPEPEEARRAAEAMLAELAASDSRAGGTSLPLVGDRLDSRAAQAVVAGVGALVVMLAVFALLAGLGALL